MKRLLICIALLAICVTSSEAVFAETTPVVPFDLRDHPAYLIASYYNAITLKDFARAYSYWNGEAPNNATLSQFTQGFADTASVRVLARLPIQLDGAAGTIHAEVPVVLFATLTNGKEQLYVGCIHTALTNVPVG